MKPERESQRLLGVTRSKAKMYEYRVPEEYHIKITRDPARLFTLTIGLLGDFAARINSEDVDEEHLNELQKHLQFSTRFFDAYLGSQLRQGLDPYLLLLGSASYYLCDLPGSSQVLANRLGEHCPNLDCSGLEDLLLWLLQADWSKYFASPGVYGEYIDTISQHLVHYFESGEGYDDLLEYTTNLRKTAYDIGTPRQLLFADVCCAIVKRRLENSTWYSLPRYSGLVTNQWLPVLRKETFVRELWPAQHLLGEQGIFLGKSAVVQMPTSAGKTKATEIIIRSALLAGRASVVVVVAPFRSLCHEIRNDLLESFRNEHVKVEEFTDVFQVDFEIVEQAEQPQILVVTPEKLVYALRHTPVFAAYIGLLIYDEGHQFDNGTRGITYELLLTSLKTMVPREVQTILISAVIKNAADVGKWLIGNDAEIVSGTDLIPTYRSVAFASWLDRLGRLEFVDRVNPDNQEFFVPRIIEQQELQLRGRESRPRVFPEKTDGQAIALYLGLKTVVNGGVAVFCGKKSTASSLCNKAVDAYDRGLSFTKPVEYSDQNEIKRLCFLHERNLGTEATATESAKLGIFSHHNNTPRGIRLAVEYAMKEELAKFVICTSTLAQGVNLPIRYLIVTSTYQGRDQIKVRDFHNLIGRAGRSGMYTEGSVIFAEPMVYDERRRRRGQWRWNRVKGLLNPNNSEPCASTILSVFDPFYNKDRNRSIPAETFILAYSDGDVEGLAVRLASQYIDDGFTAAGLKKQIEWKMNIISAVESYLMAHWDDSGNELQDDNVTELARQTFAYFLADDNQQRQIIELFRLLAQNIALNVPERSRRNVFAKTLYGVHNSIAIEDWTTQHIENLMACNSHEELLVTLWPVISGNIHNNTFEKCTPPDILKNIALQWIQGKSFDNLLKLLKSSDSKIGTGSRPRHPTIDHVVDICENALSYDGTLVINAVSELIEIIQPRGSDNLIRNLQKLQKRLKYGLPSTSSITLYEIGFADRVVSMELSLIINAEIYDHAIMVQVIKEYEQEVRRVLNYYPQYFTHMLDEVM